MPTAMTAHTTAVHPRGCGERDAASSGSFGLCGSSPRVRGTPGRLVHRVPRHRFIPAGAGNAELLHPKKPPDAVHPRGCGERGYRHPHRDGAAGSSPRVRGTLPSPRGPTVRQRFIPAGAAGNAADGRRSEGTAPVHPRGCGERRPVASVTMASIGSSPRVRGTQPARAGGSAGERFIPAGAGNASRSSSARPPPPVHPRGCGERPRPRPHHRPDRGSSPRVRGTRSGVVAAHRSRRFIPAGAGNAYRPAGRRGGRPVHPRGCGERARGVATISRVGGSSPRVRGTPALGAAVADYKRFIPAGAGNAPATWPIALPTPVHPRGCGERSPTPGAVAAPRGSSPRVRGTPMPRRRGRQRHRFIPAGAGNAWRPLTLTTSIPVHPRGCGERTAGHVARLLEHGSSPRVRGTRQRLQKAERALRFIPAGAGNAPTPRRRTGPATVHPRGCGERKPPQAGAGRGAGSSPRVRGTQIRRAAGLPSDRFIPAGAGNARRRMAWTPPWPVHPRGCGERRMPAA